MNKDAAVAIAEKLMKNPDQTFVLSTMTGDGFPDSRLMGNICGKTIKEIYFTCHTGTRKTDELVENPKSSVYFTAEEITVWVYGEATVTRDESERKKVWNERMLPIYPEGVDSPALTVIRFVPKRLRISEKYRGYDEFEL
jgi:general stress protein 26